MKKIIVLCLALCLILSLAACGGKTEAEKPSVELGALYESLSANLPEMILMEGDMRLNMLGINDADCVQAFTAICAEGLRADELWLIEAADEKALERIEALAQSRKTAKMDETSFYSPDQYAICEDGRIVTDGLYLAFIVSPDASDFEAAFKEALR